VKKFLAALVIGAFTLGGIGCSGDKKDKDTVKDTVKDTTKDKVKDTVKETVKDGK